MFFRFLNGMFQMRLALFFVAGIALISCGKTEVSDVEHVERAKQHQSVGDFKASLIELKNALQQNPKNTEARLLLGEFYLKIGGGAAAEKELQRVIQLGVKSPYINSLLVRAILLQNRFQETLDYVNKIDSNNNPDLLSLAAEAHYGLGAVDNARSIYMEIINKHENHSRALLGLTNLMINTGRVDEAKAFTERVINKEPKNTEALFLKAKIANRLSDIEGASVIYRRIIEVEPDNIVTFVGMNARIALSRLLISQGDYKAADSHISFLLNASPKHPIPNYLGALLAYENKNYAKARDYAQQVIAVRPNYIPNLIVLGSSNYALGNIEQAEIQLANVVSKKPELLAVRLMLANVKLRQDQSANALEMLEPLIKQSPDDIRLLALAGQAALKSGDLDKGKAWTQKAISKEPNAGYLRTQLAMLYLAEGNDSQAVRELELAIDQGGSPHREKTLLILSHMRQQNFDKALLMASDLVKSYPKSAFAHNLIGVVYFKQGDVSKARDAYQSSLEITQKFVPALLNLAHLDILAGQLLEARDRLDTVLAINDKNVSAMMILAQLADAAREKSQALEWLERARSVEPTAIEPRLVLARHYTRTKKFDVASSILGEVVEYNPDEPRVLKALGMLQIASGDNKAAIESFERLVAEKPTAINHYWLGVSRFRYGDLVGARANLATSLSLDSALLRSSSLMVVINVNEGNRKGALKQVEGIKRRHPKSPAGFELEGDVLSHFGSLDGAVKAYRKAKANGAGSKVLLKEVAVLRKDKGDNVANMAAINWLEDHPEDVYARNALATAYKGVGKHKLAIKEYRQLLMAAPESPLALNELALLLSHDEEYVEAEELANKAYLLRPENGAILDTLGWIIFNGGDDVSKALTFLRQANEKLPTNLEVQYHLATALVKSGNKIEAKRLLTRMLEQSTQLPNRDEVKSLLEIL